MMSKNELSIFKQNSLKPGDKAEAYVTEKRNLNILKVSRKSGTKQTMIQYPTTGRIVKIQSEPGIK